MTILLILVSLLFAQDVTVTRTVSGRGHLGEPEAMCSVPFRIAAGEVLYSERILQNGTCTIRFNPAPLK